MKICTHCSLLIKDEDVVTKPSQTEREYLDMMHSMITMPGEAYPYPRDTRIMDFHELECEKVLYTADFPVPTNYCGPLRELTPDEECELEATGKVSELH
ncbi:MAG: hypothetical protein P1P90_05875 [Patescibacteria group bacterium]|nr:hypothetical protein [Patescibacteria group bacterium]